LLPDMLVVSALTRHTTSIL